MFVLNEAELARFSKKIPKLWGAEYVLVNNDLYCLKLLKVIPGYRSSIHKHLKKDETFVGIQGCVILTGYEGKETEHDNRVVVVVAITPGKVQRIIPGAWHCFQSHTESWVMEVSTPHSDEDVVRSIPSRRLTDDKEIS